MNNKKINCIYTLIQATYWMGYCCCWNYVSIILRDRGLNSTEIGIITALATLLCCAVAPLVSSFIDQKVNLHSRDGALAIHIVPMVLVACVFFLNVRVKILLGILYVFIGSFYGAQPPFHSNMLLDAEKADYQMNYGLSRGTGSLAFAIMSMIFGVLFTKFDINITFPLYFAFSAVELVLLFLFKIDYTKLHDDAQTKETAEKPDSNLTILKNYPTFVFALIGNMLFAGAHIINNTFCINVFERVGGSETHVGFFFAVGAATEFVAMTLIKKVKEKVSLRSIFCVAAGFSVLKNVLMALLPSTGLLIACNALQFFEYGFFLPATVYFTAEVLPYKNQLKGQSLMFVVGNGLGFSIANLISGRIIDTLGIQYALYFAAGLGVFAVIFMFLATKKRNF